MRKPSLLFLGLVTLISIHACSTRLKVEEELIDHEIEEPTSTFPVVITATAGNQLDNGVELRSDATPEIETPEDFVKIMYSNFLADARVVFYSVNSAKEPEEVVYVFDKKFRYQEGKVLGEDATLLKGGASPAFTLSPCNVTAGSYKVLIVLSPNDAIKEATTPGKQFAELKKPLSYKYIKSSIKKSHNTLDYTFANTADLIELTPDSFSNPANPTLDLKTTIMPLHAYAVVTFDDMELPNGDKVWKDGHYIFMDNVNRHFTMFPERKEIEVNGADVSKISWPIDPNYEEVQEAIKAESDLGKYFFYLNLNNIESSKLGWMYSKDKLKPPYLNSLYNYCQVPENTLAPNGQKGQLATRVILIVKYQPKGIDENAGWLSYHGQVYSEESFIALLNNEDELKRDAQLQSIKEELTVDGEINLQSKSSVDYQGYKLYGLKYYRKGYCYYSIPIRHFQVTRSQVPDGASDFAVLRNHIYFYKIKNFLHVGEPCAELLPRDTNFEKYRSDISMQMSAPMIIRHEIEL